MTITLHIHGRPAPQGSKRHIGGGRMIESSRYLRQWRDDIIAQIRPEQRLRLDEPVHLSAVFLLPRPRRHKAGEWHAKRPDLSKLLRAIEDALVDAGVLADDSRITSIDASKLYGDTPGVMITIETDEDKRR